jgi:hypothetical protein
LAAEIGLFGLEIHNPNQERRWMEWKPPVENSWRLKSMGSPTSTPNRSGIRSACFKIVFNSWNFFLDNGRKLLYLIVAKKMDENSVRFKDRHREKRF